MCLGQTTQACQERFLTHHRVQTPFLVCFVLYYVSFLHLSILLFSTLPFLLFFFLLPLPPPSSFLTSPSFPPSFPRFLAESHYIAQVNLKLTVFRLHLPPKCWDERPGSPHPPAPFFFLPDLCNCLRLYLWPRLSPHICLPHVYASPPPVSP